MFVAELEALTVVRALFKVFINLTMFFGAFFTAFYLYLVVQKKSTNICPYYYIVLHDMICYAHPRFF